MTGKATPGPTRKDVAVVMARGSSSRMGRDKGLMPLGKSGKPMVWHVHRLYRDVGFDVIIVVTPDRISEYQARFPDGGGLHVVAADPGGDTAGTALAALRLGPVAATHFWLHPVDLPLVAPETVARLQRVSIEAGCDVWRPIRGRVPGHPVVVPRVVLEELDRAADFHLVALKRFLVSAEGSTWKRRDLPVADPGVTMDVDTPDDLDGHADRSE